MLPALALLCTLAFSPPQDLPTIAQVRKGMHEDMHKLTSYSDEWRLIPPDKGSVLGIKRYIDGNRNRTSLSTDDQPILESGYDGSNAWMIIHPAHVYADEPFKLDPKDDKFTGGPPENAEAGSFNFSFDGAYDFLVWSKPDIEVVSMETVKLNGKDARKVVATAKKESGKVEVDLWFDMDRWRLLRARLFGGKTGSEIEYTLEMIKSSLDEKYTSGSFALEHAKVSGYDKKTLEEIKSMTGG